MTDLVFLQNDEVVTDSLIIAEYFEKRPRDVMRTIREILNDLPELVGGRTFALSSYTTQQGKTLPKFIMNRDGAMLLTNTFAGRKARLKQWQVIQAINKLEAYVRELEAENAKISAAPKIIAAPSGPNPYISVRRAQLQ